jgi:hypothetical protein
MGKRHVYEAQSEMHPSDIDGKRPADWVNNMNGTTFMFKFMAYAHEHMLGFHDIATHAESEHPHTGYKTKWQATLCDNAKLHPAMTPQRQLLSNSVYVNGVPLPPTTTHSEPTGTLAATSGVPTWTTSSAAKALQDKVDGSTQLALNEEFICLHTTKSWQDTIHTWVEPEDVADITKLPLPQLLGGTLFANQVDRAKRDSMAMLSSSLATGVLPPDYKLMQAKTSFAMWWHLTPGDWQVLCVQQNNVWAKITKGDFVLNSSRDVAFCNSVYDNKFINSDIDPVQDGGPKLLTKLSQTPYPHTVKASFILVLGWSTNQGFFFKKYGCGIMYSQFFARVESC